MLRTVWKYPIMGISQLMTNYSMVPGLRLRLTIVVPFGRRFIKNLLWNMQRRWSRRLQLLLDITVFQKETSSPQGLASSSQVDREVKESALKMRTWLSWKLKCYMLRTQTQSLFCIELSSSENAGDFLQKKHRKPKVTEAKKGRRYCPYK